MQVTRAALLRGALAAGGFFLFTGVVTGLLQTSLFDRMVPRTALDYGLLSLTAVLVGAYVTQRATLDDCGGDGCAYGGAAGGFVAVACPHCNAVLVALFSASWLAAYVDPIRPLLGLVGVALLAEIIYQRG
ncbi:hypothetical protein [Natronorubrum sp. DTA28]|uniref:hypothetical protein n=1 Tax=Natronorubrum sp. DTA28 TaxID=3447019 RepID=UPI003F87BA20